MNLFEEIKNNYYHVEANPDEYSWVNNLRLVEADLIREDLVKKANQIKELLSHYNSDAKVNYYDDGEDIVIDLSSGNFNPDSLSKYSNTIAFDGRIYFDNDLNIVNTDIKTSSGPNVLNKDFISALNALYTFVKSNGSHYDA